jgi:hypothetical protein
VRQVFLTGKKAEEWPTTEGVVFADGAAKHGVARLEGIEDRPLSRRTFDIKLNLAANVRQRSKMLREDYPDHCSHRLDASPIAGTQRFRP